MKKILILLFATILVTSCDESETTYDALSYPSDAFVSMKTASASALESNATPIDIVVYLANSSAGTTTATTVSFTLSSDTAIEGTHYTIVDGRTHFEFAPGVNQDTIQIIPIDNLVEDGDKVIMVTLETSSVSVGFPGPDSLGKTTVVTLQDDDCAYTLSELGSAGWSGEDNVPASQAGPNSSQITTSFDGTNLLIEGIGYAWMTDTSYWDEVIIDSFPVIAAIDIPTGVITIALQPMCNTTWNGNPQPAYSLSGTGQYVSCTGTMTINYDIHQGGGVLRSFTEIITKN
ncbi:MAG: hypothetical protein L3J14_04270 [Flavobacteriaceae bacterium]|nr:hypothetical protein [Flavobacteriaceae bacterium]